MNVNNGYVGLNSSAAAAAAGGTDSTPSAFSKTARSWAKYFNTLACASEKHSFGVDKTGLFKLKLVPREGRKSPSPAPKVACQFLRTEKIRTVLLTNLDETMKLLRDKSLFSSDREQLFDAVHALQKRLQLYEELPLFCLGIQQKFFEVLRPRDPLTSERITPDHYFQSACCQQEFDVRTLAKWLSESPENSCPHCRNPKIRDHLFENIKRKPVEIWPTLPLIVNQLKENLLHEAVRRRDVMTCESLLAVRYPVNGKGPDGNTPLHILTETLQRNSIGAWITDWENWSPLYEVLIRHEVQQNVRNDAGHTPLYGLMSQIIPYFIAKGASLEGLDEHALQELFYRAIKGNVKTVLPRLLIETPLRLTSNWWPTAPELVQLCLTIGDGGRPINFREGHYARHLPNELMADYCREGELAVIQALVRHGFPLLECRSVKWSNRTVADLALWKERDEVTLYLLQQGVPLTLENPEDYLKHCPQTKAFLEARK